MGFREARQKAGLKVTDVMAALKVSDAAVYQWETGIYMPRAVLLPKLAKLYGCTIDFLLKGNIPKNESVKTDNERRKT